MEREIKIKIKWMGEVSKIEEIVKGYITPQMNGLDIGSGGAPILIQAIGIDRKFPSTYSDYVHLKGNADNLYWFQNNCMDYVFSSHCLEDFPKEKKEEVLREWVRVVKRGGIVILYLPNQKKYEEYCKKYNTPTNKDHSEKEFDITTIRKIAKKIHSIVEIYSIDVHGDYCFFIVFVKTRETK